MALNPFLKKQQPTTGYDGSGITAGTPYAPTVQGRPLRSGFDEGAGLVNQGYDGSGINPAAGAPVSLDGVRRTALGAPITGGPWQVMVKPGPVTGGPGQVAGGYDGSGINPSAGRPFSLESAGQVYPASSPIGSTGYTQPNSNNPQAPITAPNYMGPGPVLTPAAQAPYTPTVQPYNQTAVPQPNNWASMLSPIDASGSPRINYGGSGSGVTGNYAATPINFTNGTTQVDASGAPRINYNGATGTGATGSYNASQVNFNGGQGYSNPNNHNQMVQQSIDSFSDKGGAYLTNAARRGMEAANSRGLMNSSMAGGLASRYAMEAMDPYIAQAQDLNKTREGFQFQSGENALDRSLQVAVENGRMSNDMAQLLATHTFQGNQAQFDRTLQAALAQGQIDSQTFQLIKSQQFNASENNLQRGLQMAVENGRMTNEMSQLLATHSFQGNQAAFDRTLQSALAQGQIDSQTFQLIKNQQFQNSQNAMDRGLQSMLQQGRIDADTASQLRTFGFQGTQADMDRGLQSMLQQGRIDADTASQLRNMGFQGMQASLDRTQQSALQNQQYAFQGEQAALDRASRAELQSDATFQQDWLASRNFSRNFQSQLSMIPLSAAADLTSFISKYAVENPEVYTPEIINGMSNFMAQNMQSILNQYFPNQTSYTSTTQSGPATGGGYPPLQAMGGNTP